MPAITLIKKVKIFTSAYSRGRHYSFANNLRTTPLALHAILPNPKGSTFLEFFWQIFNCIIKRIIHTIGIFVFATNFKAVRAVGLVKHNNIVSKATVGFRQLWVMTADCVKQWHVGLRELIVNSQLGYFSVAGGIR